MSSLSVEEDLEFYKTRKEELDKAGKDLDRSFYSYMIKLFSMFSIIIVIFIYAVFNYDTLTGFLAIFLIILFYFYVKILYINFENRLNEFRSILDKE